MIISNVAPHEMPVTHLGTYSRCLYVVDLAIPKEESLGDKETPDSRYSMSQYFQKYHPQTSFSPKPMSHITDTLTAARTIEPWTGMLPPTNMDDVTKNLSHSPGGTANLNRQLFSAEDHIPAVNEDYLHSTLRDNQSDTTLAEPDMSSASVSTLSLGTTLADNAFQEGLAQLDANIAKLQQSLKTSRLGSTL